MSGITPKPGGIAPRPIDNGADYCINLVIKTNLSSVNEMVLKKVAVGEVLPIAAEGIEGPIRVLKDGEILGTVLSALLLELINCINNGTEYEAPIIKIDGAICQVKIVAKK
ncbi:MAG: hypothetical protein J6W38_13105 [Prevotella sp.]|nr:hypothetical protein [Prevotella sp.]